MKKILVTGGAGFIIMLNSAFSKNIKMLVNKLKIKIFIVKINNLCYFRRAITNNLT
jgi:dTDP-D-glucose 4,6-dehydratase